MSNNQAHQSSGYHEFICYGELLWDLLPSGAKPGGAPMNVAYHLKKLGHNPAVVTCVGTDPLGNDLLNILREKNIETAYIQQNPNVATGIVHATPNEHGEMSYDIVAPAAWDEISWIDNYAQLLNEKNFLVFGSLICRNNRSRETLFRLIESAKNKVLDINLRPPHFSTELIIDLLQKADTVKVNRAELDMISKWNSKVSAEEDQIKNIQDSYHIPRLIVTLGGDGAMMNLDGKVFRHPGFNITVEDTVGSGDAFLAALLSGLFKKQEPQQCLAFACAIGALVTSKRGAWPDYQINEIDSLKEKNSAA